MTMKKHTLIFSTCITIALIITPMKGDWNPTIFNAIKWSEQNQGEKTINYTTQMGITRVILAYHGGVDMNASGEITEQNKDRFASWVHERLPQYYCGPVVLDYEEPWWSELSARTILPARLQEILDVYIQGVEAAKEILPTAQWGYWGLPLLRNTSKKWTELGLSLEPLVSACSALYPDIYDGNRGNDNSNLAKNHIESVLQMAAGRMPVYVFVTPRFTGEGGDHSHFMPDDVFLRHVNGAMKAVWVDEIGQQHKIAGVILWDTYKFTDSVGWVELDRQHTYYFKLLQALIDAWKSTFVGTNVDVGIKNPACQFGLAEPLNSGDTIYPSTSGSSNTQDRIREQPTIENDRIPSGRVPDNRLGK